jgi:ATP-dependent protease ClpP protease subunit
MSQAENLFKVQRIFGQSKIINKYAIYFDGSLGNPEDYREEFELIRNMDVDDVLKCHYNGPGGNAFTMIQFLRCFKECKGTIIGSVEGECQSAYTFMFLASHGFEVSDHCKFMCHNYNGGLYGSGHELKAEMDFDVKWAETIMRDAYKGFLSDKEIEDMLEGKIYYYPAEEILSRCQKMVDSREAEMEESPFIEIVELDTDELLGAVDKETGKLELAVIEGETERSLCFRILDLMEVTYKKNASTTSLRKKIEKSVLEAIDE